MERVVYVEVLDKRGGVKERDSGLMPFLQQLEGHTPTMLLLMINMFALSICALILMRREILLLRTSAV